MSTPIPAALAASALEVGYPHAVRPVLDGVDVVVPRGRLTAIVGPNACGKSTLLRAFARILAPERGGVTVAGRPVGAFGHRELARTLAFLPQSAVAPEGITVADLVARGRFPHQGLLRQWSDADERAVDDAMARTRTTALATRPVATLSGGQRQRVWIAMILAQRCGTLLLDEPTTFLDLAHQLEVLDLCRDLVDDDGATVVAVLHDLNQAARYADHLLVMREGRVVAAGAPVEVLTAELVEEVFAVRCRCIPDPETGSPLVVPLARAAAGTR